MTHKDVQPMAKAAHDVAEQIISKWVCRHGSRRVTRDAVRKKQREAYDVCQDVVEIEMSAEEFDMVRSKVFNFHKCDQ